MPIQRGVLKISALGFLTHSFRFASLRADLTMHIISIFLVDQLRICFEPRLKKSSFLTFRRFRLCRFFIVFIRLRIILLYCSCCFLYLMFTRFGPFCKRELCCPPSLSRGLILFSVAFNFQEQLCPPYESKQEETESMCMESKNIHFCKIPLIMKIEPVMTRI